MYVYSKRSGSDGGGTPCEARVPQAHGRMSYKLLLLLIIIIIILSLIMIAAK